MHAQKKQKVITSDIDWCIENYNNLSPSNFIEIFNYGDVSSANMRYSAIISMKRFLKKVPNGSQIKREFKRWRGSQQEQTFWNERKIKLAREFAEARARLSVINSVGRIAEEEANILGNRENDGPGVGRSSAVAAGINTEERSRGAESPSMGANAVRALSVQESESETSSKKKVDEQKLNLVKFQQQYEKMDAALKWTLNCSGRKVEDVLYMYGSTLKYEHLCHSFVLDPWDKTYEQKSVFTTAEIQEIKSSKSKKMPAIDDKVLKYLDEYKELKSSAQVRHFINRLQPWDANFDRKESHDMDWIRHSYYTMVRELERGGIDDDNNSETWLLAHIWTIVDRVFDDVQLDAVRGENSSHASSSRKNKERVPQGDEKLQKKKMGPRLDLILRRKRLEFGAGEAGKQTDDTDSKLLRERDLKLPKALKDMMMPLKNERGSADGLRVVGLLQYGLKMTTIIMDVPYYYVHRITRTNNVEVPSNFEQLPELRKVLYMALTNKAIVLDAMEILLSEPDDNDDLSAVMEPPEEDLYQLPSAFHSP